jgi:transposase
MTAFLREKEMSIFFVSQCPACYYLTRAPFPTAVSAPVQYGTGIQTLATYLVEGHCIPYARTSQLLQELLAVHLSAGSIATFVTTCHQQLAEVETDLKALWSRRT